MNNHTTPEPSWDANRFTTHLRGLAQHDAPRLFAVGLEYGEREDAEVAAYGMAFQDHTEVITLDGTHRVRTIRPEDALRHFHEEDVTAHVVWLPQPPTTAPNRP